MSYQGNYKNVLVVLAPTQTTSKIISRKRTNFCNLHDQLGRDFRQVKILIENVPMDVGLIGPSSLVLIMMAERRLYLAVQETEIPVY